MQGPPIPPPALTPQPDRLWRRLAFFGALLVLGHLALRWCGLPQDVMFTGPARYLDLDCYRAAGEKVAQGINPYGLDTATHVMPYVPSVWQALGLPPRYGVGGYLYPPTLAYLVRGLPANGAAAHRAFLWLSLLVFGTVAFIALSRRASLPLRLGTALVLLTALGTAMQESLSFGQINPILAAVTLWAFFLLEQPGRLARAAGYVLGAFTFWLKLVPIAFVGLALPATPRRMGALAVAVAGIGLVVFALSPTVFGQWLRYTFVESRQLMQFEESWHSQAYGLGLLVKSLVLSPGLRPAAGLVARLGVAAMAAWGVWQAYRSGYAGWGYLAALPVAPAIFLLNAITWPYHLTFLGPPALVGLVVLAQHWRGRGWVAVLMLLLALWMLTPRFLLETHNLAEVLAHRLTTLAALALVTFFALGQWVQNRNLIPR